MNIILTGLALAVVAYIAAKAYLRDKAVINIGWLKKKLTDMRMKNNVVKAAAIRLERLVEECPDHTSLRELYNSGYDIVLASVSAAGTIEDLEVFKDIGSGDPEVDKLLGDEGMVVIK